VITDPALPNAPRGAVFESTNETNNALPSPDPVIIELPPPSDLQVTDIHVPGSAASNVPLHVSWDVKNVTGSMQPAVGRTQFTFPPTRPGT